MYLREAIHENNFSFLVQWACGKLGVQVKVSDKQVKNLHSEISRIFATILNIKKCWTSTISGLET